MAIFKKMQVVVSYYCTTLQLAFGIRHSQWGVLIEDIARGVLKFIAATIFEESWASEVKARHLLRTTG